MNYGELHFKRQLRTIIYEVTNLHLVIAFYRQQEPRQEQEVGESSPLSLPAANDPQLGSSSSSSLHVPDSCHTRHRSPRNSRQTLSV